MAFADKKILGIIPARGGSKGLFRKNIVPLNGLPLIAYSIMAGMQSKYIDTVLVSSDDPEILRIANEYGAHTLKRPSELATDSASIQKVISHAIEKIGKQGEVYDIVVLLQPTSPLRTAEHIDAAFMRLNSCDSTSLISVYKPDKSPYKCFVCSTSGYLEGLISKDAPFMNRQDLPEVFMPNGAIYIFSIADFLKESRIPVNRIVPFIMTTEESIDIDTRADLDAAAIFLNRLKWSKK